MSWKVTSVKEPNTNNSKGKKARRERERERESEGIILSTLITFTLGKVFYQIHTTAVIPLGKEPLYPLDREFRWTTQTVRTN